MQALQYSKKISFLLIISIITVVIGAYFFISTAVRSFTIVATIDEAVTQARSTVTVNPSEFLTTTPDIQASKDYMKEVFNDLDRTLSIHWRRIIEHYISLPLDPGYGSHQLPLLAALLMTSGGPVMEMGCGYFSTVLLHRIAVVEQNRYLLSADTDLEWLSKFQKNMSSSLHEFRHINETSGWDTVGTSLPRWSIALIDHRPGERRVLDVIRVSNMTDIVILHDTETASYRYEEGLAQYPYRYRYTYLSTMTDVMTKHNATIFNKIRQLLDLTIKLKING